ncbi:MAG: hydroxymethylglutaryl-CoA synthase [Canibacter sp.]
MSLGIIDLEMATTHFAVELDTLAEANDVDPNKYRYGLRQDQFGMPALDEDPISMGATAAARLLERTGTDGIRTLLFATESGVDQSKAAGMFVQDLLDLPTNMRILETKQACYAGTASLQVALGIVARHPQERVLVIMSDIARYAVNTAGEPTQGAGAIAMLIGADPELIEVEPTSGVWSAHINDFWRPNDLSTPLVDGALSLDAYLGTLTGSWDDYAAQGGAAASEIDRYVHHQPFTKMSVKAYRRFAEHIGTELDETLLEPSLGYTPHIGNSYTASLYVGLTSLLHYDNELDGKRVGLFSYGSGAAGEFFTVKVLPGYRDRVNGERIQRELAERPRLSFEDYRALHAAQERGSRENFDNPYTTTAPYRFAGVRDGARVYEATPTPK